MKIKSEYPYRIKKIREELKLTAKEFAEKLEISPNTIRKIECGSQPLSNMLKNLILKMFDINEEWFEYGLGNVFNKSDDEYTPDMDPIMKECVDLDQDSREVLMRVLKIFKHEQELRKLKGVL